jgi:hypothetical protein
MFDWLEQELKTIKTRRFHVVDGPAVAALRAAVEESEASVPRAYKEFVLRFGNAKLYKRLDYYLVGVLAAPVEEQTSDGEKLYRVGHHQSSNAYFKAALLRGEEETPVFVGHEGRLVKVADGFEAWLTKACESARRSFTKKEWRAIEKGPSPFSDQEKRLVEARRNFRWRVVGISSSGDIQFEVHNGSNVVLPFLTIGIRGKRRGTDATLKGGVWLPVASVLPGQTAVIEKECYKEWVDPQDVEAFEEPDPEPEDRDRYWEFKPLPT